ncbi:DeoR/GlpR family DNA-binding transcription regulator [Deinococcus sp. QL22]|uniref:DeoR/GlpR family DNA-binding transcription regulator n=1 Tax=Deinococcus sp. QL22 TaxID=2939437 RepID=UPI002017C6EB|nr:DeoR/GlpR family DNA-binding transcription regulator [Deinococcus sp. QL22]UQN08267.1 DeoR/GlpR family DNA-binding transcription regulator [Deinococcus sp. QL22]
MSATARQNEILQVLAHSGEQNVPELSNRFGVSEMTIRRDLNQLAASGLVVRTHGGASRVLSSSFEPMFEHRVRTYAEAKEQIAAVAAQQIEDGQTLILDGGSTGLAVARALVGRRLTVCTLNLRAAQVLSEHVATRVIVPGGIIRTHELSFVGSDVERMLSNYHFDVYIMTASGIDASAGLTEWNAEDAAVKRAALASARRTIVACDASKFGQVAFARICDVNKVDTVVSDPALAAQQGHDIRVSGTQLLIA